VTEHVWYASYGSNLSTSRFGYYLYGGRPAGATRTYPGARDRTPPRAQRSLAAQGRVFFGWESRTWGGGGVAFLDPDVDHEVLLRAYRITGEQFADVVAQEMHRAPGTALDLDACREAGRLRLGPGRYETLVVVGHLGGEPVITFTCADGEHRPTVNAPGARYLQLIGTGLREAHGLVPAQVVDYLAPLDGIRDHWSSDALAHAIG
jgi:hypothetical protein